MFYFVGRICAVTSAFTGGVRVGKEVVRHRRGCAQSESVIPDKRRAAENKRQTHRESLGEEAAAAAVGGPWFLSTMCLLIGKGGEGGGGGSHLDRILRLGVIHLLADQPTGESCVG